MRYNLIIPLAGPDYFYNGKAKGELPFMGGELLIEVLRSRPWFSSKSNPIFVFLDSENAHKFYNKLRHKIQGNCKAIFLSSPSNGPLWSSLAGIASIREFDLPLIIDFADIHSIDYQETQISQLFQGKDYFFCYFKSESPNYSYISLEKKKAIAREKKVISCNASLGVYGFIKTKAFLDLISEYLSKKNGLSYNELDYLTPIFDGCLSRKINLVELKGITDIKEA